MRKILWTSGGRGCVDDGEVKIRAVAEGWTMKNIPRSSGDLSCLIICFFAIVVVIIIAFLAGWFG